jgi:predicted PurR-regulated permease PerM
MSLHFTTARRRGSSAEAMPGPPEQLDSGAAEPVPTRTPGVRITSLGVLALIAVIVFLHWAQAVLIPITLAIMLSYALTPVVGWLKKRARLPKAAGAALTLAVLLGGLGTGISSLQPEALDVLDTIPQAAQKLNLALHGTPGDPAGLSEKIKRAAREIENTANASDAAAPASGRGVVPKNVLEAHSFRVRDYVMLGTASLITGTGAALATIALVYLLLVAGDTFRRTLVRISGDSVSEKKLTVQMLDEIEMQIQRYLLVQIAMGILMGVVAWFVFASVGLDNALFWAFMGGVLHLIPYAGPTLFVALSSLVAYVQFDGLQPVVIMAGGLLATLGLIALLLVPWLTQQVGRINAVIVLVTLLFWGWLWGVWGLLLGVPMVMAVKAVCERFGDLQPISEFLGYRPKNATVLAPVDRYRTRHPDDSAK